MTEKVPIPVSADMADRLVALGVIIFGVVLPAAFLFFVLFF